MANPFFSGRIPPDLLDRVEKHCAETGETKTDILINALATYFDHPVAPRNTPTIEVSKQMFAALEERVAILENLLKGNASIVIGNDNNKENSKVEEIPENTVINADNNVPNESKHRQATTSPEETSSLVAVSSRAVEVSSLADNNDNTDRGVVITSNPSNNKVILDNNSDNNTGDSDNKKPQEIAKLSDEAEHHRTEVMELTPGNQPAPRFELITSVQLREIAEMTQPQVDGHKRKVNQKYKKLEQALEERKILEVPEKIDSKKPITVQDYPYDLFYAGQDEKGKDLWNLLPFDNDRYQQLSI